MLVALFYLIAVSLTGLLSPPERNTFAPLCIDVHTTEHTRMNPPAPKSAVLSEQDATFFEQNGYLLIKDALSPDLLAELNEAADALYARAEQQTGLEPHGKLNLRNCVVHHDAFLQLLDHPTTAPLAWQILGWNIQMVTTHLIVLPSQAEPSQEKKAQLGWHRDGGTSSNEMSEPHPRILLKIAYALSDQTLPSSGATWIVPGSNRMIGKPPVDAETGLLRGAKLLNVPAGSAFIFEQRTFHSIGHNWSGFPRKTLFVGYAYRWVKPMDYVQMPDQLIARANPVQRQLLGDVSDALSYYIPRDEDVPLKAMMQAR